MAKLSFTEFFEFIKNNKSKTILVVVALLVLIALGIFYYLFTKPQPTISPYSRENISTKQSYFDVNAEKGYLYKSKNNNESAIGEYIEKGMPINGKEMIPTGLRESMQIVRIERDSDLSKDFDSSSSSKEHYFLKQTIKGFEVHNASIIVHIQNSDEIYAASGNIVKDMEITEDNTSLQQAITMALQKAREELKVNEEYAIEPMDKKIINFKVLGLSEDATNYLTLPVQIELFDYAFSKIYYVRLSDGEIIHIEDLILHAKQREVYDCGGKSDPVNCPLERNEGSAGSGVTDADNLYDYMGEIYDFYATNFNRDGLDGRGGVMSGFTNIYSWTSQSGPITCSRQVNAYHARAGYMAYCPGAVVKDVTAHEFGHGVVNVTARLAPGYQHGALNESYGDVFASALDGNWTVGEGSIFKTIRSLSDPPSVPDRIGPPPDKLYTRNYDCVGEETHHNAGVPNKAFYLMTEGGDFNGCTVNGVGMERSRQIVYKALVHYLSPTANFYDMYSAINKACADLYGADSGICKEVAKAYQAVEMDQQPSGDVRGPYCRGATAKTATCVGVPDSEVPTEVPVDVPTATPTGVPGAGGEPPTPTTADDSGSQEIPTIPPATVPLGTPTPTPTPRQMFTCEPDPQCIKGGKTVQLCPLKCSAVPTSVSEPTSSIDPTATTVPGQPTATPTSAIAGGIASLVSGVEESRIREFMSSLVDDDNAPGIDETQTRLSGSQGLVAETNYVRDKFEEFGLTSSFQNFTLGGTQLRNVIGRLEGQDPNSVYLVTSHIDAIAGGSGPAPGADDNGSGTVVVMETARLLKSLQSQLKSSIEFVTFSGEEQGLHGSYYYVNNIPAGKTIKGVINLDMVGNSSGSECVNFKYKNYNGGDVISNKVIKMIGDYNLGLSGQSEASSNGQSDHKPFWDKGIPAIFAHECAFSPVYHTVNDKTQYISYSQLTKTTKAVVAAVADLATE